MRGRPNDTSEGARAHRREVRKVGRVAELERRLNAEQWQKYEAWQRACGRIGVRVNESSRFEFLSCLVTFKEKAA